jgi:hypothetical protein
MIATFIVLFVPRPHLRNACGVHHINREGGLLLLGCMTTLDTLPSQQCKEDLLPLVIAALSDPVVSAALTPHLCRHTASVSRATLIVIGAIRVASHNRSR